MYIYLGYMNGLPGGSINSYKKDEMDNDDRFVKKEQLEDIEDGIKIIKDKKANKVDVVLLDGDVDDIDFQLNVILGTNTDPLVDIRDAYYQDSSITKVPSNVVGWDELVDGAAKFYRSKLTIFNKSMPNLKYGGMMFSECQDLAVIRTYFPKLEDGGSMFRSSSINNGEIASFDVDWDMPLLGGADNMFNSHRALRNFKSNMPRLGYNGTVTDMFYMCEYLETFEGDMDILEYQRRMFYNCANLKSFKGNMPKLINGEYMFFFCDKLESFKSNLSSLTNDSYMFWGCTSLADVELTGTLNCAIDWTVCPLTVESMVNIMNAMVDLNGQASKTMQFGAVNIAKLSDSQKMIAINKNWVLS